MEIDVRSMRLLAYLGRRVTAVVGNNAAGCVASVLGMSEAELFQAGDLLFALGYAVTEPMSDERFRRWGVTDAGVQYLSCQSKRSARRSLKTALARVVRCCRAAVMRAFPAWLLLKRSKNDDVRCLESVA